MALLNKAESGGFGLELFRSSTGSRVLRFGVYVAGAYHYATRSLDSLNGTSGWTTTRSSARHRPPSPEEW
jgi:hypothetical protein